MIFLRHILILCVALVAAGCGGGSAGTTQSQAVTLKLSTNGTPSANLAGIGITVTLPDGVTPEMNSDGSVSSAVATVTGAAAPGTVLAPVYTPVAGNSKASLRIVMASSGATGFGEGEFITVKLVAAAGNHPTQSDFTLSAFNPIDISGGVATGLNPAVSSLAVR